MKTVEHFTPQELAKHFSYDAETGELTWAVKRKFRNIGDACGYDGSDGYRGVALDGKQMLFHRVAWAIHYGEWPKGQIDHINRNRKDNRIANLRVVTSSQNRMNSKTTNRHGVAGVSLLKNGRWQAMSYIGGVQKYLGLFDTKDLAHQAYIDYVARTHADYLPKERQ